MLVKIVIQLILNHGQIIIKNDVILSFSRGEDNVAGSLMGELEQRGFHPESKTHIHSMTLKAFVREQVEGGKKLPFDLFGVYIANKTKITTKE